MNSQTQKELSVFYDGGPTLHSFEELYPEGQCIVLIQSEVREMQKIIEYLDARIRYLERKFQCTGCAQFVEKCTCPPPAADPYWAGRQLKNNLPYFSLALVFPIKTMSLTALPTPGKKITRCSSTG